MRVIAAIPFFLLLMLSFAALDDVIERHIWTAERVLPAAPALIFMAWVAWKLIVKLIPNEGTHQ
jgi:hypothetical protein